MKRSLPHFFAALSWTCLLSPVLRGQEFPAPLVLPLSSGSELTLHRPAPEKACGTTVLICPGGGYGALMMSYEGHDVAKWLNEKGVAGAVLRYKIAPHRHPAAFNDAVEAMRLLRTKAPELGLDPKRIGAMGFSAGGHLAAHLGTRAPVAGPKGEETISARPDFLILVYPVISMTTEPHTGSRDNLLGPNSSPELAAEVSAEKWVTAETPPAFLVHSRQDKVVPFSHSEAFHQAMQKAQVACEFLQLEEGGHGLGAGKGPQWIAWQTACDAWLKKSGLLDAKSTEKP